MGNEHDSWLNSALGIDVGALKDKAKTWVEDKENKAKEWAGEKVDQVKKGVNDAENWAKKELEDGKHYVEKKEDDAKKWLNEKKDDIKKEITSAKQAVTGDESGKPIPRPIESDCKPQSGKVPGPKNHIYCGTHGHVLDTDAQQIIAASVAAYVKAGLGKIVKAAGDEAKGGIDSAKKAVVGDESGGKIPRPMEQDCKPQSGKVPGPKNHVYCGTHGHVLDVDAKMIIAASVASYVKDGIAKAVRSIDPSSLTAEAGRSGPLNSPSSVNNQNPSPNLAGGGTASGGESYFVTGGQKGELADRLKGLYEVANQMDEMAKLLEKKGDGIIFKDKNLLASAKNMAGAAKATLTLAKEIDKWSGSEKAASIEKGSKAVEHASKLIKAVETVSKLKDARVALEKMDEKPNQASVEAWADSVGVAFASAGAIIPTDGLPGFMGDYYKGLFEAPKNYISAFKTIMHVHYDNVDTESGLTGETLLRDATRKVEDLGKTGLDWSGDLSGVFYGGYTLPKAKDGTEFQRYMIKHKSIAGTNMLKTTVDIGIALLTSSIETELDDADPAKRAWLNYVATAR